MKVNPKYEKYEREYVILEDDYWTLAKQYFNDPTPEGKDAMIKAKKKSDKAFRIMVATPREI
jgi:hypothetical protein